MAFVFKEKLTLQTIFCILLALGGIGLLYKSGDGTTLSLTGVLLVMASALSYAIYIVGANRPLLKNIATLKLTFYVLLFGMTLFLVRIDFGRSLHIVHDWYLWGNLIALAIFPTWPISFLCTTLAAPIYRLHPDGYPPGALEPLTCRILGVTVFGESLTLRLCCGIILIILAVTLIIAGSNVTSHLVRFRKLFPRLPLKKKNAKS